MNIKFLGGADVVGSEDLIEKIVHTASRPNITQVFVDGRGVAGAG